MYTDSPRTGEVCSGGYCCCASTAVPQQQAAAELATALLKATVIEAAAGGEFIEQSWHMERKIKRQDGVMFPKRDGNALLHFTLTIKLKGIWI